MSRRPLRDELREVFDELSEPAHPALASRIRHEIQHRGAPAPRAPRLAVAVAVLVSLAVVAGLLLAGHQAATSRSTPASRATPAPRAATPAPAPSAPPTPSVAPAPGVSASPPAIASPPPGAVLPAFSCAAQSGGSGAAGMAAARAGQQAGYDRFVIQFDGPVPPYAVTPHASASFTADPSGSTVTVSGTAGLQVTVRGVANWQQLTGPADMVQPGTTVLREARRIGDFEGTVTWALGLSHAACFRAYTLTGPDRLVVDVQD
jgi:hypothetical protein